MSTAFECSIKRIRFDENYTPAESTRLTTNFANLARGESREENLRRTLAMINNRFNSLATVDNPKGDRYHLRSTSFLLKLISKAMAKPFHLLKH